MSGTPGKIADLGADQKRELLKQLLLKKAARAESVYPLSHGQRALWFLHQLAPEKAAYNLIFSWKVASRVDALALERAFQRVVDRHPTLRSTYSVENGQLLQRAHTDQKISPALFDASQSSEASLGSSIEDDAHKPFDLEQGPVLRISLYSRSEDEHILLLVIHHIAVDFSSVAMIMNEVFHFYSAAVLRINFDMPAPANQYSQYVRWQSELLAGPEGDRQFQHWQSKLAGELAVLDLSSDRPRPAVRTHKGESVSFDLDAALTEGLKRLARSEGTTLYTVLLSGLHVLLHCLTGQDDILVASPAIGRTRAEFTSVVGYFANPVVMRADLAGNPTFKSFLAQNRQTALHALANQDYPFPWLVDRLGLPRDAGRTPITDVVFFLQKPSPFNPTDERLAVKPWTGRLPLGEKDGRFDSGTLLLESYEVRQRIARFDLAFLGVETEQSLFYCIQYNSDIYNKETVAELFKQYEALLSLIIANPEAKLSKLASLIKSERGVKKMEKANRHLSRVSTLRGFKRKGVDLSQVGLIKTDYLTPEEKSPLVISPTTEDVDLADWAKSNGAYIEQELLKHGVILFRGFNIGSISAFEQFASSICPELFDEYSDLPREAMGGKVYGSTPYPADQAILPHNESSHMPNWPMKIWFYCVQPSERGGETPIMDCRKVFDLMPPRIRDQFAEKRLMYIRNFTGGLDKSWQEFFATDDRREVEDYCSKNSISFEWKSGNGLRIRRIGPGVARHPKTGEMVFFNQIQAHHFTCLDPSVRESLSLLFKEEDYPRHVYYGDGTPIDESVINEIRAVYEKVRVSFAWQQGDVMMLDNMLTAHSRTPYAGPRKIVVSMGEMVSAKLIES